VSCGLTLPLDHCPMHGIQPQPEVAHGFELLFHTLEYFGRCSRCRQSAPADT
jgi:Fur family ferric uptake transcriptional regulator